MDFELSITICSWNTKEDTLLCLQSLRSVRNEANFEVIVIDNGSADGTADEIDSQFPKETTPWLTLIRSEINLGFTGGHNACLRVRKAKNALLLNSDAFVHKGAIETLVQFSDTHPDSGLIGPQLLNPDGSLQMSCRRFPNPIAALFRSTLIGRLFPNNQFTRDYLMSDWDHSTVKNVDWISGAALFVKGEVIDKIGMFDEKFFMYCEDVDWCFRAHKAGFLVTYVPSAVVTHKIGTSSSLVPNKMIVRFHRSMFRFYLKNMISELPFFAKPFAVLFAASGLTLRASLFIIKNGIDRILAPFQSPTKRNINPKPDQNKPSNRSE